MSGYCNFFMVQQGRTCRKPAKYSMFCHIHRTYEREWLLALVQKIREALSSVQSQLHKPKINERLFVIEIYNGGSYFTISEQDISSANCEISYVRKNIETNPENMHIFLHTHPKKCVDSFFKSTLPPNVRSRSLPAYIFPSAADLENLLQDVIELKNNIYNSILGPYYISLYFFHPDFIRHIIHAAKPKRLIQILSEKTNEIISRVFDDAITIEQAQIMYSTMFSPTVRHSVIVLIT